ncbi:MAG: S1C family serine protease [Spirochaetia bacterium]
MKLYSRNQLLLFVAATFVITFLIALGLGVFNPLFDRNEDESLADDMEYEPPILELQTNSSTLDGYIQVDDTARFDPDELANISVYENRNKAVVNITTEQLSYTWFLEPVPREGSSGSGSIIDKRGYVLTNNHVVENAYKVFITLSDGVQVEGNVVGSDPENDLAVLKFDPPNGKELNTIPMGSSSNLRVGQKVLAIGNPFAFDRTLTTGIVSGLGRPLRTDHNRLIQDMIQTDASINPGNSGGPLLDSQGNMIGINTMIYSPSGGSIGIGFAVPVDTAKRVVPELIEYGFVKRGWIDIYPIQLFPALVNYAGLPVEKGILVSKVYEGSNADKAGIRGGSRNKAVSYGSTVIQLGGDIIVGVDDESVASLADLFSALEDNKPDETVPVEIIRGRKKHTIEVKLSERPKQLPW